ncbi:P-loop containing nucleoside triphosphate hydrolase protein [Auriscalpium vulgare]|uniref:P-loop containing nucleoside triphosphate hydrolase protein n=1 Tax=Auriscalpium vulgare TaxID=40419 RepID=A0ACB8RQT7_9AGAM|nr:P-loop containing nucleoside triphosphate hydrolase protein [Auriscalpium vulgare]
MTTIMIPSSRISSYSYRKSSKPKEIKARKHKLALVVVRLIDDRGRYARTAIKIKSTRLRDVLVEVNEGVEGLELNREEPEATPELLFHSYEGLRERLTKERAKVEQDDDLIRDILAAILLFEEDQGHRFQDFKKLTSQGMITYDHLELLFKPNQLVFNFHVPTEQNRVLIVRSATYLVREDRSRYLNVVCDVIHNDGKSFGLSQEAIEIDEFTGARAITELPTFPLKYHEDNDGIYNSAVELGKKYVQMPPHSYHEISGRAMRNRPGREDPFQPDKPKEIESFYTSGHVMISPLAFRRYEPDSTYNPPVRRLIRTNNLTDDQYAICSPILLGFAFDRKTWGGFAMSRVRDVSWNDGAFDALVLGDKQKSLIRSLVRQHASQEGSGFDDIIKGKGQGLIGLLAGPPGSGKTLTAEAVAEVTHRPLYAVSAGELGTDPVTVESCLLRALELAQMWNAVLLLDEAEVFLQKRNATDVNRNALVSIFLRQLEYYQGIMILTTNMVNECDHAFESRIHFSVAYPELSVHARKEIWAMFFKKASLEVDESDLVAFAEHPINGRQIKNAFSSAQTISRANGSPQITIGDINVVLGVLHDWRIAKQKGTVS